MPVWFCSQCVLLFVKKEHLIAHMVESSRVHSQFIQYFCTTCTHSFKTFTHAGHHFQNTFECFSDALKKRSELGLVWKELSQPKCPLCEFCSPSFDVLQNHMLETHSDNRPTVPDLMFNKSVMIAG